MIDDRVIMGMTRRIGEKWKEIESIDLIIGMGLPKRMVEVAHSKVRALYRDCNELFEAMAKTMAKENTTE